MEEVESRLKGARRFTICNGNQCQSGNLVGIPELKILHVVPSYYPATYWGGPIFSVYALNNALARLPDVSLTVLTTDTAGPQFKDRLDQTRLNGLYPNQEVIMTHRIAGADVSFELLWKLPALIRRTDVVHLTATYSFPTIPTLLLCRIFNKPLVWSLR